VRKYANYTNQELMDAVTKSKSISQVLKLLGLKAAGGNYNTIKSKIAKLSISTEHFTGQLWSKGTRLKDWKDFQHGKNLKKPLIKEKGHKCEKCLQSDWFGVDIPLELHHIDGNKTNNNFENLQLLCCNCHATTYNWRNRKRAE
jgi:hypothetical protein